MPRLTNEVQAALAIKPKAHTGGGVKDKLLNELAKRLHHLPAAGTLVHPALSIGEEAMKVLVGILFTLAAAAYWVYERDRAIGVIASLVPRPRRKKLRDTWHLIEKKLGAFIRGQILMITFVSTVASLIFLGIGEPYWLLIGIATGFLEIVPVVGPVLGDRARGRRRSHRVVAHRRLRRRGAARASAPAGLHHLARAVLGGAVGLPPLLVLVSVSVVGILIGPFYVLLSVPIASLVVTVVDVVVRGVDPAEAEVPAVLFSPKDSVRTAQRRRGFVATGARRS